MTNYCLISNSCLSMEIYHLYPVDEMMEWRSPLLGSLFLNDYDYLKFCKNYDYYIKQNPIFDKPKNRYIHSAISDDYPVMYLDDVEIHWIHEVDTDSIIRKFEARLDLSKDLDKIFLWTSSEFFNIHSNDERDKIFNEFISIDYRTIFLTEIENESKLNNEKHICYFVKEWENYSQLQRNSSNVCSWSNQKICAEIISKFIYKP